MNLEKPNKEEAMGYLIGRAALSWTGTLNKMFSNSGLDITFEQWKVLVHLWIQDGQTISELAAEVWKDKTSMSRLVDNLEKRNLVVRIPDKQDKRNKLVYLTNKGKELQEQTIIIALTANVQAQTDISDEDWEVTKRVLRKIYRNMSCEK